MIPVKIEDIVAMLRKFKIKIPKSNKSKKNLKQNILKDCNEIK